MAVLVAMAPLLIGSGEMPKEWRRPSGKETNQEWRRSDKALFLSARADFDGDKVEDEAEVVITKSGEALGLVVWSSTLGKWIILDESLPAGWIDIMGISVAKPGTYRTACGKGYFECKPGDSAEIVLSASAIDFFKEGSANSYFHWDSTKKAFTRTWISD